MNGSHIDERAELYALGSLSEHERAEIDAHAASCPSCARLLGEAEETVLALERESRQVPFAAPPLALRRFHRTWLAFAALAAAFIIGFIVPHGRAPDSSAHLAMLESHFSHAQFEGRGPLAKVLYAHDRSWYYVIVGGAHRYTVVGVNGARATTLGTTASRGATSELFIAHAAPYERVELRDGAAVIETASLR